MPPPLKVRPGGGGGARKRGDWPRSNKHRARRAGRLYRAWRGGATQPAFRAYGCARGRIPRICAREATGRARAAPSAACRSRSEASRSRDACSGRSFPPMHAR